MCLGSKKLYYPRDRYPRSLVPKPPWPWRWWLRFLCFLRGHNWQRHVWSDFPQPLYCTCCLLFFEESPCVQRDSRGWT